MTPREHVPLAPHCTLGVGGPARWFVEAHRRGAVLAAPGVGPRARLPLRVLGGGSNLVVADAGVDGLVLQIALRGVDRARAGWRGRGDAPRPASRGTRVVRARVERGWAGLECLSGIPGLVGATPIQNVGAYGQEVSDTVDGGARARRAHRRRRDARARPMRLRATATAASRAARRGATSCWP